MPCFRWGVFGTGAISAKFVAGLAAARNSKVEFVASRSGEKARAFANALRIEHAVEGYAEAAARGGVDAVYIATPPSEHLSHALMCIEMGIPVLVEKPFGTTAGEAEAIARAARARSVFAMEAMWTRFLPAAQALRDAVVNGSGGPPRMVVGSFGTSQLPEPGNGMFDPALGGGAIAHLAPYPLSLSQWLFGEPTIVQATGTIRANGIDESAAFQLRFAGDVIGSFVISLRSWAFDNFDVLGSEGMVRLSGSIVRPYGIELFREAPRPPEQALFDLRSRLRQHGFVHRIAQRLGRSSRGRGERRDRHYLGNGYHYQADEVEACVTAGRIESSVMPLDDSIATVRTADEIRTRIRQEA